MTEWLDYVGLPEFAQRLFDAGIVSLDAIAALTDASCDKVSAISSLNSLI